MLEENSDTFLEILCITGEQETVCMKHKVIGWDQLGSLELKEGNVWVCHRATAINCAKEQLCVASPAEREMREMLMRIGGDDPDERSKHGVPRQQDLTQQQPPTVSPPPKTTCVTTVLVATIETAITRGSTTTAISSRTRTTSETRCTKTTTST